MSEQQEKITEEDLDNMQHADEERQGELKRQNEIKNEVLAFCETISERFNLKVTISAFDCETQKVGMWNSKNVNMMDEMAFSKLYQSQY